MWCIGFQRIHNQGITILGGNTKAHVFVYLILHSLTQMTSAMFSSFAVQWHWSLDMAIVSSSVVVEDKPRVCFKVGHFALFLLMFLLETILFYVKFTPLAGFYSNTLCSHLLAYR